jgi:Zn-dependent M28 family amino/carboxypeptidase
VKPTKEIILVVFFAAEESGLLGSFSFSWKKLKKQISICTHLNIEMIGVPMGSGLYCFYYVLANQTWLLKSMNIRVGSW